MDFLGIGPLELMFVILIALIVIGPKDMTKTARSAGRYLNRMYRSETWRTLTQASRTLQTLPNRLAREAQLEELEEIRKDLKETDSALKEESPPNPVLKPWITPYDTPEQFKTIAPPQPAEPPTAQAQAGKPTSTKKAAPAKPSKAAAKPPVNEAKKPKPTKPSSTEKSGAAKPSKAAAKPSSAAKKKSHSSNSKAEAQPRTASKSSSSAHADLSRSKPAKKTSH